MRHFLTALICVFICRRHSGWAGVPFAAGSCSTFVPEILIDQGRVFDDSGTITAVNAFSSAKIPSGRRGH